MKAAARRILAALSVGLCAWFGISVHADVSGFDNTVDNDFWKTTGRTDVPQVSVSSSGAGTTFTVPGRIDALAVCDVAFTVPGTSWAASGPLDRRFSTKPFALVFVFR